MHSSNKRIAINTAVIYLRLAIVTVVSLLTTRYVLQILGAADYGLFNVVGSVITMLNCISTAMYTTTRRFINVEMGKPNGNLNKIFNISLILHIGFALLILFICESLGIWYINNYLNVSPDKLSDAYFIFQITTIVSCIGIMNVPFQGLIEAFEKFWQTALVDIINTLLRLVFVVILILYTGNNALRLYAVMLSSLTLLSFILYQIACHIQWKEIVRFKLYIDKTTYKEILIFNNYTALGAFSNLGRTQGCNVLVNYFFGTVVNAAFAIAYQIQYFVQMFTGNLGSASAPQITQNYSNGKIDKAIDLCSRMNRYTILITTAVFFTAFVELESLLKFWLSTIPEDCLILCKWILICALCSSFSASISTFIHATGKVKWFQIIGSIIEISVLPISYMLFRLGYPPVTIIIVLTTVTLIGRIVSFILMRLIIDFNVLSFIKSSYVRPILTIAILTIWLILYSQSFKLNALISIVLTGFITLVTIYFVGLTKSERIKIYSLLNNKIKKRNISI